MSTNATSRILTAVLRHSWPPSGTTRLQDTRRRGIDPWWAGGLLGSYDPNVEAFLPRCLSPVRSSGGAPGGCASVIAFLEV